MSKLIASAVMRGAQKVYKVTEEMYKKALSEKGQEHPVQFPNTAYYLPVIYGFTGHKVEKLADIQPVLDQCKELLWPEPSERVWLPYLGNALDCGVSTLFCCEIIEALKYIMGPHPVQGIWLGAADDVIMRERGVEFVDGTAPGFAAVIGAAPTNEDAVKLARELQEKNLYVFMAGSDENGKQIALQLAEEGVELGWETRLVPFGPEISAQIYSLGFATRAAMSFGNVQPGDAERMLKYNKYKIFAFIIHLSKITDEDYATGAGALSYGFPIIAHRNDVPQIIPYGITLYEHVVSGVPLDKIVQKSIEVRGLKIEVTEVKLPIPYGPAFEGERVRKENLFVEFGGTKTPSFELLVMAPSNEVEDGKVTLHGADIDSLPSSGGRMPIGILVKVAGEKMKKEFEPVFERQIHRFINYASGVMHIGQRSSNWIRISREAFEKNFRLNHLGEAIIAGLRKEYGRIIDKVQVDIFTDENEVLAKREEAEEIYKERDQRIKGLTDASVEKFYSCTLCQSFAPYHVCVITPERIGLCGAYTWLDCQAAYEVEPTGGNQPIDKGVLLDEQKGIWSGVNEFVKKHSHGKIENVSLYSMINDPMTCCGCFEVILALLPLSNGIMAVPRGYPGMTPVGMTFSTLAGMVGGGQQTPGFMGVGKTYLSSKKFISYDGGLLRLVWMPKDLKEELRPTLQKRAEELGYPDLIDMIADETVGTTEEEILGFLQEKGHPALTLPPLL